MSQSGTPPPSSNEARARMKSVRQRGTKPEEQLQKELSALGLNFEINERALSDLRRHVDVLFRREKVAVQVNGCFWHSCPRHATIPKSNTEWWEAKLAANRRRDEDTELRLRAAGWTVVRVWEHEDMAEAAAKIEAKLGSGPAKRRRRGANP